MVLFYIQLKPMIKSGQLKVALITHGEISAILENVQLLLYPIFLNMVYSI